MSAIDPQGTYLTYIHMGMTFIAGVGTLSPTELIAAVISNAYHDLSTQSPSESNEHAMACPGQSPSDAARRTAEKIGGALETQTAWGLGVALHNIEDMTAPAHRGYPEWHGGFDYGHFLRDAAFSSQWFKAIENDRQAIQRWRTFQRMRSMPQMLPAKG